MGDIRASSPGRVDAARAFDPPSSFGDCADDPAPLNAMHKEMIASVTSRETVRDKWADYTAAR